MFEFLLWVLGIIAAYAGGGLLYLLWWMNRNL